MKRLTIIFASLAIMAVQVQAQLLYSISGNGLQKPSYVLGTYHFASSSFLNEIPGFQNAFQQTQQVCGELVMDDMMKPENVQKLQLAMMMPEGTTIQDMLDEEQMKALNDITKQLLGADFSNPMVGQQLGRLTPGALLTQLTSLLYLKKNPTFNLSDGVDTYVQTLAKQNNKGVMGLETVEQQAKCLFQSASMERQKQLLLCFVKHQDYEMQITDELVKAYYDKDLDAIERLGDIKLNDGCDATDEEDNALIYGRNADWLTKMPAIMKEKPTFFAVGCGHLMGEKGLLNLLKEAGYDVNPVE
jgi:hypothetical protein